MVPVLYFKYTPFLHQQCCLVAFKMCGWGAAMIEEGGAKEVS
jgi:hypothetical protein